MEPGGMNGVSSPGGFFGGGDKDNAHCEHGNNIAEVSFEKQFTANHLSEGNEDMISISASDGCGCGMVNKEAHKNECGDADSQPKDFAGKETKVDTQNLGLDEDNVQCGDTHCNPEQNLEKDVLDNPSPLQVNFELTETLTVSEEFNTVAPAVNAENGCDPVRDEDIVKNYSFSGVKRSRITIEEHLPSVHVTYNSLTRASKKKLEELLRQWSEWHARHHTSSHDATEVLESGEETFFPALHAGLAKTSPVSFWIDNQTRKQQDEELVTLDRKSVPLYDRGFALGLTSGDVSSNMEGGIEIIDDASRCFNCGSYNHELRECPRPRDNVAVNNARKQHKSKRNQSAGSRNQTRYYQNSPSGKFEGLRPGVLDAETRKLLGLGEFDPPPWLNRMQEMGYPPGYLDLDVEDQPSGITIFAEGEVSEEQEDGEILEKLYPKEKRKMTVEFPGINAPIPDNADERLWAGPSSSDLYRQRPKRRFGEYPEHVSRGQHYEHRSWDFRDDPPGDPGYSSRYHSRYSDYAFGYSPPRGSSLSDSGRNTWDGASPYSPSGRFLSPHDYRSARFESWNNDTQSDGWDRGHRYHSWR